MLNCFVVLVTSVGGAIRMEKTIIRLLVLVVLFVDSSTAQCPSHCGCRAATRTVDCRPTTSFKYSFIPDNAPNTTRVL